MLDLGPDSCTLASPYPSEVPPVVVRDGTTPVGKTQNPLGTTKAPSQFHANQGGLLELTSLTSFLNPCMALEKPQA